jgi:hypothetical protein
MYHNWRVACGRDGQVVVSFVEPNVDVAKQVSETPRQLFGRLALDDDTSLLSRTPEVTMIKQYSTRVADLPFGNGTKHDSHLLLACENATVARRADCIHIFVVAARNFRSDRFDLVIIVILEFVMMNARAARATSHGNSSLVVVAVQPAALIAAAAAQPSNARPNFGVCRYFDDFGRSQKLPRCKTLTRA